MSNSACMGPAPGSPAPDLAVSSLAPQAGQGEPRVLAFVQGGLDRQGPETIRALDTLGALGAIRAELRGLGAELVVVSPAG
ncbi:MAG TPA: hypothetical protein VF469_30145, partial [Kofleriaceae bacterium]